MLPHTHTVGGKNPHKNKFMHIIIIITCKAFVSMFCNTEGMTKYLLRSRCREVFGFVLND